MTGSAAGLVDTVNRTRGRPLRLYLICTLAGLPDAFALANPRLDERDVARDRLESQPELVNARVGQLLIADKGYASREFEIFLNTAAWR